MLIPILRWLTFAASLAFLLIYFKGGASVIADARQSLDHAAGRSYGLAAILMAFLAGTILLTQVLICLQIVKAMPWTDRQSIVTLGSLAAISGIASVFLIRYRYLGRFWSASIRIQAGHEIVGQGPYRAVRHPLYAFSLLIYAGVALAFGTWWNMLACGLMMIGYVWLSIQEDRYLQAHLPGYPEFQQRTRYRLVPGLW